MTKGSLLWNMQQEAKTKDLPCARCARIGFMTVDHIIPVALIEELGLREPKYNDPENLQYLCRACNVLKRNHFDFNNPKTFPNLRRYIAEAEHLYA